MKYLKLFENIDFDLEEDWEEEDPDDMYVQVPKNVKLKTGDIVKINPKSRYKQQGYFTDRNGISKPMTGIITKHLYGYFKYQITWLETGCESHFYNNIDLLYNPSQLNENREWKLNEDEIIELLFKPSGEVIEVSFDEYEIIDTYFDLKYDNVIRYYWLGDNFRKEVEKWVRYVSPRK